MRRRRPIDTTRTAPRRRAPRPTPTRFVDGIDARLALTRTDGDDQLSLGELARRVRYERDVALQSREFAWRQVARMTRRRAEIDIVVLLAGAALVGIMIGFLGAAASLGGAW